MFWGAPPSSQSLTNKTISISHTCGWEAHFPMWWRPKILEAIHQISSLKHLKTAGEIQSQLSVSRQLSFPTFNKYKSWPSALRSILLFSSRLNLSEISTCEHSDFSMIIFVKWLYLNTTHYIWLISHPWISLSLSIEQFLKRNETRRLTKWCTCWRTEMSQDVTCTQEFLKITSFSLVGYISMRCLIMLQKFKDSLASSCLPGSIFPLHIKFAHIFSICILTWLFTALTTAQRCLRQQNHYKTTYCSLIHP